jgi:hypothetical protein
VDTRRFFLLGETQLGVRLFGPWRAGFAVEIGILSDSSFFFLVLSV